MAARKPCRRCGAKEVAPPPAPADMTLEPGMTVPSLMIRLQFKSRVEVEFMRDGVVNYRQVYFPLQVADVPIHLVRDFLDRQVADFVNAYQKTLYEQAQQQNG